MTSFTCKQLVQWPDIPVCIVSVSTARYFLAFTGRNVMEIIPALLSRNDCG